MFKHLRACIERSSADSFSEIWWVNRPSKIAYFSCFIAVENILRLQISMNNIFLMHVLYSWNNLLEDNADIILTKTNLLILYCGKKILSKEWFHDQINIFLINKEIVEFNNVRVIQISLNFDLADYILLLTLFDRGSRNYFNGIDKFAFYFLYQIYFSKESFI